MNFLVRFIGPRGWRASVSGDGIIRSSRPRLFKVRGVEGRGGVDVFRGGGGGGGGSGGDWCSGLTDGTGIHRALCHRVSTSSLDESKSTT